MSKPTIADVARLAGVSTATVSRALKTPAVVSQATRERVRSAVQRINYVPNGLARNLRRQRSGIVILLVRKIDNPFYLEVFRGVEAAAREHGLSVLMGNVENDDDGGRRYFNMVRERAADGMILMTGQRPPTGFAQPQLPIVVALESMPDCPWPRVQIDNVAAARAATQYLLTLGHRRIAHVTGPTPEILSLDRSRGYHAALRAAGLDADPALEVRGDYSMAAGQQAAQALLRAAPVPSAVFCDNDTMAMGVITGLHEAGLAVPGDISVMGFDDIVFARGYAPPLTTVHQPRHDIGVQALALLMRRMAGEQLSLQPIVLPTHIAMRASTAPAHEA